MSKFLFRMCKKSSLAITCVPNRQRPTSEKNERRVKDSFFSHSSLMEVFSGSYLHFAEFSVCSQQFHSFDDAAVSEYVGSIITSTLSDVGNLVH